MRKILVIDDDGIVRDALNVFLTRAGYKVFVAPDGLNGMALFKNNTPDLVILDRDLPGMTGSEIIQKIRQFSKTLPVIILTGYDDPEDARKYIEQGATVFLSKAEGLSRVLDEVDSIFNTENESSKKENFFTKDNKTSEIKILIADDDEQIRNVLSRHISNMGYIALLAENGRKAVDKFKAEKPDIVLLDIQMPEINGLDALKMILNIDPDASIMMITGNEDEDIAKECLKLGAFDYTSKPINFKNLEIAIKARLMLQDKL